MSGRNKIRLFAFIVCVLGLLLKVAIIQTATAQTPPQAPLKGHLAELPPNIANGATVALDPSRGNCNACHQFPNTPAATGKSKIGVRLNDNRAKYPDDKKLRALIWDAQQTYPQTIMPPYGKHRILSEAEIDDVVAWLQTQ